MSIFVIVSGLALRLQVFEKDYVAAFNHLVKVSYSKSVFMPMEIY